MTFSDLQKLSEYGLSEVVGPEADKVRSFFRKFGLAVDDKAPVGKQGYLLLYATIANGGVAYADSSVGE